MLRKSMSIDAPQGDGGRGEVEDGRGKGGEGGEAICKRRRGELGCEFRRVRVTSTYPIYVDVARTRRFVCDRSNGAASLTKQASE